MTCTGTHPTLDETFGQYQALPIPSDDSDPESSRVATYLKSVRTEAELDASIHYLLHRQGDRQIQLDSVCQPSSWELDVASRFSALQSRLFSNRSQSPNKDYPFVVPETAAQWRKLVFDLPPPPLSVFLTFDRAIVFKLVVYIMRWLSVSANKSLSQWAWLVLVRVEKPLDPAECAIVHDLGRKAQKLYSKLHSGSTNAGTPVSRYTVELVRVIVGRCFGQSDILEVIKDEGVPSVEDLMKKRRLL